MNDVLGVAGSLDAMMQRAVEDPSSIDDRALGEWMGEASSLLEKPIDKLLAREIRRGMRTVRKLAAYWSQRGSETLVDWRNGVDEALGSRGFQPQLDFLRRSLELWPEPETFEEVKRLHRTVHFDRWMEGVTFEEWYPG